ncbi:MULTISPECIES: TetR/AcrR family transcriptional regulator [unclassified Lysinibacillus]|uniref:TetR/AcrR family transcriptional regulator n=1 Tax=unclassified Lysinibacillus TaxID=2636778 RepID=UPI0038211558
MQWYTNWNFHKKVDVKLTNHYYAMKVGNLAENKQAERSEEIKKQIVESARKLFSKQGYDFVTIRAIAWMLDVPIQPFTFAGIASEDK